MAKKGYFSAKNVAWRELPSGYTQVLYIESSGTQYIDTGFKPNQDTRVVLDFQMTSENSDLSASDIFGARSSASSKAFAVQWNNSNDNFQHFYNNGYDNLDFGNFDIRQVVEMNKNVLSLNGETHTRAYSSFQCAYALYLFALNNAGTVTFYSKMRMYSCQIYDNGTLIRDYVPCLNASGTAGLYDMVYGVFYGNAGTGSFSVGETLRENVARVAKKVYFGDKNGIARKAKKAYFGDKNGIARRWYVSGVPISTLAVGSSVFMNVDGVRTEFLVIHQGLPSSVYDASCNGTWLLSTAAFGPTEWDSTDNDYENSDIHDYLNHDILSLFDSDIQNLIKQVKIPYTQGTGLNGSVATGANGLSAKLFLLSLAEVNRQSDDANVEGAVLGYFAGSSLDAQDRLDSLSKNCGDVLLTFRSPGITKTYTMFDYFHDMGLGHTTIYNGPYHATPALILPSDAQIDENFNVIA